LKKTFFSLVFVAFGAGLWVTLSTTAQYSIKKWDAKFATVLRQGLSDAGLSNEDILSSVNELHENRTGQWTTHTLELKSLTPAKAARLKQSLEDAGARVEEVNENGRRTLLVRRGQRLYQKITYKP
jgi:hypothetical protein